MYRQLKDISGNTRTDAILRVVDNAFIPANSENADYQAYTQWIAQGNTILPA